MRAMITIMLALGIVGIAAAYDLGNRAPIEPESTVSESIPVGRQGGDTISDAFAIPSLPFHDTGTTAGYPNDYSAPCAYNARDVVYSLVPAAGIQAIDVDLCYSSYNTAVFVYDSDLNVLDCNDDFYFGPPCYTFASKLENVHVVAGQTYYIVVDGHVSASGAYVLDVTGFDECFLDCPPGYLYPGPEGEPPLVNWYVDNYNGGCNTPGYPFQDLGGWPWDGYVLCGVSGWYIGADGNFRDTDWFTISMPNDGPIELTIDAEYATYLFELGPQDCENVNVIQSVVAGPCQEASMTIAGYPPFSTVWLWVGPTVFAPPSGSPPQSYDYVCWIIGDWYVAIEPTTWSTVKALFK